MQEKAEILEADEVKILRVGKKIWKKGKKGDIINKVDIYFAEPERAIGGGMNEV